jgi:hypothetical protein
MSSDAHPKEGEEPNEEALIRTSGTILSMWLARTAKPHTTELAEIERFLSRCLPAKVELPNRLRIRSLDLTHRVQLYFRLPFVKLNSSGDIDDFTLEHGDPLVIRHF